MRLLVISHTPHHERDGTVVGWAPTIRELDQLASRFTSVRHVACLYPGEAPRSAIAYRASNIELVAVPPSGADGVLGKLDVLRTSPTYIATILRELKAADMVHVRAPANIALIAMLLLTFQRRPAARWFKYAGNWRPTYRDSASYLIQRWWLRQPFHRGVVTVNGQWSEQPPWVRTFFNPSLADTELAEGKAAAAAKDLTRPLQLLYVGQLLESKGAGRAIEILERVRRRGVDAQLTLIGDGEDRARFEALASQLGIAAHVHFLGWQEPATVHRHYARAHLQLLPSASEGWPKVLSEGMAYGVVPLAGAVSAIPQYIDALRTGAAIPPHDLDAFAEAVLAYAEDPVRWRTESERAVAGAESFSYRQYLTSIDSLLRDVGLS